MEAIDTGNLRDLPTDARLPGAVSARLQPVTQKGWMQASMFPEKCFREQTTADLPRPIGKAMSFRLSGLVAPRVTRFLSEQEFEGVVTAVDEQSKSFFARLTDFSGGQPEEEAEIAFDEISPDDWSLIVPGAIFSWNIGRATESAGQVRRVSELRFRRFFRFSPSDIDSATKEAARMLSLLTGGNDEPASTAAVRK